MDYRPDPMDVSGVELSQRCKMGDTSAMLELARSYKDRCGPELQELLDAYERQPDQDRRQRLRTRMTRNSDSVLHAEAYIMWLLRAARFGDERAQEQIDRLPEYAAYGAKARSGYHQAFPRYLPFRSLLGHFCKDSEYPAWGGCIRAAGFPDVPDVKSGAGSTIVFWPSPGIYIFSCETDYIPADECGFGAESERASFWFDEFFCPIADQDPEKLPAQLEQLDRAREEYWASPSRSAGERKYRQRLHISTQLPWGKTWEEAAPLLGLV